jgi:ABC-2 type transport system permease protein
MDTTTLSRRAPGRARGRYGFRTVTRMEWHKLRTVRSTWSIVAVFGAGMIGLAMLALGHENYAQLSAADRASFDPTSQALLGLVLGQLLLGTLGVLAITTEFSSGMIRATFAAAPSRPLVLAAKAAVLGAVTLAAGEIFAVAAFFAGQAILKAPAPHATLGQPGVLRAVLMAGAYPALVALISLGLSAIIRHTAGAICALVGLVFVLPLSLSALGQSVQDTTQKFMPDTMRDSLTSVRPAAHLLSPALTFGLLCGYALVALAAGAWALARRDA